MALGWRVTFISSLVKGSNDLGSQGGARAAALKWAMSPDMGPFTEPALVHSHSGLESAM